MPGMSLSINRIAFIDEDGHLATIAPDGSRRRQLTPTGSLFQFPTWAPDGSLAAIGSEQGRAGVYVLLDNSHEPGLPDPLYSSAELPPIYLFWTPAGDGMGFIAAHEQGLGLFYTSATESTPQLMVIGQPCFWDWQPDGLRALVHSGGFGIGSRLAFIDREGKVEAVPDQPPGLFQTPAFAPGGQAWAYGSISSSGEPRLVIAAEGETWAEIDHQGIVAMAWCPQADLLAYISPPMAAESWYGPLRLLNPAGDAPRILAEDTVLAFFWSPDGRHIAILTLAQPVEDAGMPDAARYTNGRTPPGSTTSVKPGSISLHLDLIEVDSGKRRRLGHFKPSALFMNQFMPFFDQYSRSQRLWSPDSRALVMPAVVDEQEQLLIFSIDQGSATPIANGRMPAWSLG